MSRLLLDLLRFDTTRLKRKCNIDFKDTSRMSNLQSFLCSINSDNVCCFPCLCVLHGYESINVRG